ncbi:DUF4399 domain-containing protein [Sulfitobacter sp. JBTF-M27]|uniref:DUF4399 domain-containing protein n=1 Tax=Sulfitobacter sediminilitoris TaxID=2698830 RepID=A0A6P0CEH3_9RHOB|nr:DUF4399 domain-containing protein [Sulfitobacter sediminilitoris]NEK24307.1 DUF4399 domain-containing protein [Sulfitobacter sediminilitoris]
MKHFFTTLTAGILLASTAIADGHRNAAPEGAQAYIISPSDGATVSNPVTVVFGLTGMGVAPAGTEADNTGHHHLLINTDPGTLDLDTSLPATDQVVHFGGGQTQVIKDLPSGTHTLQLLLGDLNHVPHDPPVMSDVITITVE